jgi:UDP-N-acetylmuramoyl-L-alanyl-D-glutamate--2,6-diaminopimelate ligase
MPDAYFTHRGVAKIVVADSRKALAILAANFYRHPARTLRLVGVTGTNGKTTVTHLVKSVLEAAGENVGLIGTIGYLAGGEVLPATHTTPESLELNSLLATMVAKGCSAVVMEVSSHSLALHRVDGLGFHAGVFTNLTQDHLDFHGSMDNYCAAKRMLFESLRSPGRAVINADDPYATRMTAGLHVDCLTYGVTTPADVRATDIRVDVRGLQVQIAAGDTNVSVSSSLTGRFNAFNVLAAYATGHLFGIPSRTICEGIAAVKSVRGRFEQIHSPAGWTAVIDYAHTPDALENCLRTIREIRSAASPGRVVTVFGCGGDRDRSKRPVMGRVATDLSDVTIVTSDNPRHEDPRGIIREIMAGAAPGKDVHEETDRRVAIHMALAMARRGDIILIAGKGHEDYQVIGDEKRHFDDREEIESFLRSRR